MYWVAALGFGILLVASIFARASLWRKLVLVPLFAVPTCALGFAALIVGLAKSDEIVDREMNDPAADFVRITGMEYPAEAELIRADDSHIDFEKSRFSGIAFGAGLLDGTFVIVIDANLSTVQEWTLAPPPWANEDWEIGPVPAEIFEKSSLPNSENTTAVLYVAKERCCSQRGSSPYWNAELLVINPNSGRVMLSSWDF